MKSLKHTLKLSALQVEILNHRLEVDDAICDAIFEPGASQEMHEKVAEICRHLLADDLGAALDVSTALTRLVLDDACVGSVYCAARGEDVSYERYGDLKVANMQRSAEALGRRVSEYLGYEVECRID